MRPYGQYCPVAVGSEVIAERWTPLIMRELVLGSTRFNEIERGLPGISRTLLAKRLKQLELRGVIELVPATSGRGHEYVLTDAGRDLEPVIMALGEWTVRWLFAEPDEREVDPITLTWWMHRRVDPAAVPAGRVVLQFDYRDARRTLLWLMFEDGQPSVCTSHPGFEPDVFVTTDTLSLSRVFSGIDELADARARGKVRIEGPRALISQFPRWFLWSPFRPAVRLRLAAANSA
ncbi:MAG: winged helix-turn-helix transcriptional regulator [Ilumatobacteraceae bacterium]